MTESFEVHVTVVKQQPYRIRTEVARILIDLIQPRAEKSSESWFMLIDNAGLGQRL